MTFAREFSVRFGDVDHARIVYYPRFFHYFHQTFEEWFGEALGVPYAEVVNGQNVGFPIVRVESEFFEPIRYGERMRVELELAEIGNGSITMRYTVVRLPDGKTAAQATVKKAAIDGESFTGIPIPAALRERFERFRAAESAA